MLPYPTVQTSLPGAPTYSTVQTLSKSLVQNKGRYGGFASSAAASLAKPWDPKGTGLKRWDPKGRAQREGPEGGSYLLKETPK